VKNLLLIAVLTFVIGKCEQEQSGNERERMVQTQIIARGVQDTATLRAIRTVPRHEFVPQEYEKHAYDDYPLPIGYDQTISQPYIVAVMTELIKPRKGQHVLEVGTGSGYQAAVLAEIVDSVYSIEIVPELATSATKRLKSLGYRNIVVRCGDGYLGWPECAPFDAILVTAAAEQIPKPLIDQLRDGGRMVIPVGSEDFIQTLTLVEKKGKGITTQTVFSVRFVPLIHSK
jgi:protein-L-isoaspartate(D-aspartate) O-methyltransferase